MLSGVLFAWNTSNAQVYETCAEMGPICTDAGLTFTATVGSTSEPGNDYGCLATQPNPSWYYFEIATDGDIAMSLSAPSDIDFIIWGPFPDLATAISLCGSMGVSPLAPEVDCSYSATASETPYIPGAVTGEVYVMLITNYAAVVQDVTLYQTGGSGSTDCDIVVPDPCISEPGTYTVSKNGSITTGGTLYLCEGDEFTLNSNGDYTLPNDTIPAPIGDGIYSAQLMWLVYDGAPDLLSDPSVDPNYTGLIIPGEDIADTHDGASPIISALGCGTYWFVPVAGDDGVGGNGGVADGVTDNGGLDWDKNGNGCYELGDPIAITYSCPVTASYANNCNPPTTINGVDIDLDGGSGDYTVVNLGSGNLFSTSVPNGGTALVTDLNNGSGYSIQVTDEEGCVYFFDGVFSGPIFSSINITPALTCPDASTGTVNANVSGTSGSGAPYVITMNGVPTPGTSAIYADIAGTSVTVVAADSEGCIADSTVTITSSGHFIDISVSSTTNVSCHGENDGAASITAVPTPSGSVVSITWDPPTGAPIVGDATNTSQTGMMPGTWLVTVLDDTGCEVTIPVVIAEPSELDIFVSNANEPVCYGYNDGSITVESSGGSGGYTYTWDPTNPTPGSTFNSLTAGTYTAYVTDANGCTDSIQYILGQPDSLWVEWTVTDVLCNGDTSGVITIDTVWNAQGSASYFWNLGGVIPNPDPSMNIAKPLPAGSYVLTVQDEFCDNEYTFTITENPPIEFVQFGAEPAYCRMFGYQSGNGVIFASATGGVADYTYEWVNLETGDVSTSTTWGGLNPGTYQMTVTDAEGCTLVQSLDLDSLNPIADFDIVSAQLDQYFEGTAVVDVEFINTSQNFANPNNPNADTTFFWNNLGYGGGWFISESIYDQIDTSYYSEDVYEICLVAINKNGCTDTTCKEITVYDVPEIVAPNIFTPGSNTKNDVFTFAYKQIAIVEFNCVIYDRWGIKVGEITDINGSWDGNDMNGDPCSDGVYFYHYSATSSNGTDFEGQSSLDRKSVV